MIDSFRCAIRSVGRKRGRTLLTMMGIMIGVTSVIIISNISNCGTAAVCNELDGLGMGGIDISTNANGYNTPELSADELGIVRSVKGVKKAMPLMVINSKVDYRGISSDSIVWGVDSSAKSIVSLNLLYGRFINDMDVNLSSKVCMVDQEFARNVYHRDNIVGKKISISSDQLNDQYEVIGVLKTGSGLLQNVMGNYIPNFIYAPYTTIQEAIGSSNYQQIIVRTDGVSNTDQVEKTIKTVLNQNANTTDGYDATNLAKQKDLLANLLNIVTMILSAVSTISLLVAGLSIMTVMLVSVNERTREIGIKKSIGAKKSAILTEFLLEAAFISLIGCIIGIVFGTLISWIGASFFHIAFSMRYDIMIYVSIMSMATGLIFGVYPAFKAANLKPVDALRSE
ncbi:MAG: ABC transporter permease [Bacillota bacterium]|nr:ABC transporter permease [Bacillota bacterium]